MTWVRSTGATLRASFFAFPAAVMALGVLPMPGEWGMELVLRVMELR